MLQKSFSKGLLLALLLVPTTAVFADGETSIVDTLKSATKTTVSHVRLAGEYFVLATWAKDLTGFDAISPVNNVLGYVPVVGSKVADALPKIGMASFAWRFAGDLKGATCITGLTGKLKNLVSKKSDSSLDSE